MKKEMIRTIFFSMSILFSMSLSAQMDRIEATLDSLEAESHLRFLTSDELKGRNTGTNELLIAGKIFVRTVSKIWCSTKRG